jgi:hypothetical protein
MPLYGSTLDMSGVCMATNTRLHNPLGVMSGRRDNGKSVLNRGDPCLMAHI